MAGQAVVIGGSIAGLTSALALARRGLTVDLIERDTPPPVHRGDSMDQWWRRGAPQARHSHICLALARNTLMANAPDVWQSLRNAGAREVPNGASLSPAGEWIPAHDDADLVGVACRRAVLEDGLRRAVCAEPGVSMRAGIEVTGFIGTDRVAGVHTSAGAIDADVVIDASGRASSLTRWLADYGAPPVAEDAEPCGILYISRFYRFVRYPGVSLNRGVAAGGDAQATVCVIMPGDDDTFSITIGVPPGDAAMRGLRDPRAFDIAARLHPAAGEWLEPGTAEPISEVALMPGLQNRMRRFVVDGEPIAPGLLPVGDAVCITDPAFARGMSLAIAHAFAMADLVAGAGTDDARELSLRADDLAERLLRPWFDDAVAGDRARSARWAGAVPPPSAPDRVTLADIAAASPHDRIVQRAMLRRFNLLEPPDAVFGNHEVVDAVRAVIAAGIPPAPVGPSVAQLREVASAVAV